MSQFFKRFTPLLYRADTVMIIYSVFSCFSNRERRKNLRDCNRSRRLAVTATTV